MPIFPPFKWLFRRSRRWQRLIILVLIGILLQPVTGAYAQLSNIINEAQATYTTDNGLVGTVSNRIDIGQDNALIDPIGNLVGCDGQPLDTYAGFSMALYEPDASGLELGGLVNLTRTVPGENGLEPNDTNVNPFFLRPDLGRYNFLLDPNAPLSTGLNQTDSGAQYILVINPPENAGFTERRVLIDIIGTVNQVLSYRATSLDGQPLSVDGSTELTQTVRIDDAFAQGLTFFEFGLNTSICKTEQMRITKSADRAAAQPGDVVIYRLNIQNVAAAEVGSVIAIDTLPVGFELLPESVTGQVNGNPVTVNTTQSNRSVAFSITDVLAADNTLDIFYATRITPDAVRGSGRNSAIVTAERTDSGFRIQDGPSIHRIRLDPGILSDCGTLIGRVFEDKNFDGEQQSGEAGIPNAVIFLDDGNRVVTDADGLYSVKKMLPGQHTGTLDLSSLPGYTLAPNLHFSERNSLSRLVNLAPGGLVRMNFGVTPTFEEAQE